MTSFVAIRLSRPAGPDGPVSEFAKAIWIGDGRFQTMANHAAATSTIRGADITHGLQLADGVRQSRELRSQRFYDHFYLLIQAAACGLGIAMVPKILVLDDLRSGKLVAPLDFIAGPFKIVLWIAPHVRARSETKALVDWLTQEFRKPGMQGEAGAPAPMSSLRTVPRR